MDTFDTGGVTGIVWRRVDPVHEADAEAVMRELMQLSRQAEGFLGSEIFPPIHGVQEAYVVLYRFNSGENLRHWLGSAQRLNLLAKITPFLLAPPVEFFFAHRRNGPGTASSVFSYRIRPDRAAEFQDWRRRIQEEARKWEGFLGTESFDTLDCDKPEFVVVVRFNHRANLDAWLTSAPRSAFMKEVNDYVEHYEIRRMGTGFEGWFDFSSDKSPPAPWRQGLVILSALFPVIMILRQLLGFVFELLPFPVAFLVLLTADLSLLTFVVMPHYSRLMSFWLRPKPESGWRSELKGWAIILGLIAVTLIVTLSLGTR